MTAQLYCFGESGNAYKCALALTLTGTPWQPVFVDFFKGEALSFLFENFDSVTDKDNLIHRMRLFNSELEARKR